MPSSTGNEAEIDASLPTAWVDMSGNGRVTNELHHLLGDNLVESCIVGATHWDGDCKRSRDLPGAKPTFFFAPARIAKRDAEWGQGELWRRGSEAGAGVAKSIEGHIAVERFSGAGDVERIWLEMLENRVSPDRGIMISI